MIAVMKRMCERVCVCVHITALVYVCVREDYISERQTTQHTKTTRLRGVFS